VIYVLTSFTYNMGWINAIVYGMQVVQFKRRMAEQRSSGHNSSRVSVAKGDPDTLPRGVSSVCVDLAEDVSEANTIRADPAAFVGILRTTTRDPEPEL
jgi:hypothetical protein